MPAGALAVGRRALPAAGVCMRLARGPRHLAIPLPLRRPGAGAPPDGTHGSHSRSSNRHPTEPKGSGHSPEAGSGASCSRDVPDRPPTVDGRRTGAGPDCPSIRPAGITATPAGVHADDPEDIHGLRGAQPGVDSPSRNVVPTMPILVVSGPPAGRPSPSQPANDAATGLAVLGICYTLSNHARSETREAAAGGPHGRGHARRRSVRTRRAPRGE